MTRSGIPDDGVDEDLLADYVGGALDGTDEARVAELIATRPDWRAAHDRMAAADAAVRADLAQLGTVPTPAPPELLSGLAERFRAEAPDPAVVPLRRTAAERAARRRRARWLAGAAAAVLLLAFAGLAGASLFGGGQQDSAARTGAAPDSARQTPGPTRSEDGAPLGPNAAGPADTPQRAASGTDYTPRTLLSARDRSGTASLAPTAVPAPLRPLTDPDRLNRCLHQLGTPSGYTASLVDFARFRGRPAAVVVASDSSSDQISVVGPACGTDAAHLLYQTAVVSVHMS